MFIVRGPNLANAHRHTRHTRVGDTKAQRHTHKHSTHTYNLHVCCLLVRDEVNWFLQHVRRQYNKMEINILCGRARL